MEEETAFSNGEELGTKANGGLWNAPSGFDFSGEIGGIRWTQSNSESSDVPGIGLAS